MRKYVFTWDRQLYSHVLRVPLSIWQSKESSHPGGVADMPRDILGQSLLYPLYIQFEVEAPQPDHSKFEDIERAKQPVKLAKKKLAKKKLAAKVTPQHQAVNGVRADDLHR